MKHMLLSLLLLLLTIHPATGFTEEPVPHEGFMHITEHILNILNVLENDAKNGNFNQLHDPVIQDKFDTVSTSLQEYEYPPMGSVNTWPEGDQKKIASELKEINFLYRAFSLSQNKEFRDMAEENLVTVRKRFQRYVMRVASSTGIYLE